MLIAMFLAFGLAPIIASIIVWIKGKRGDYTSSGDL